MRKLMLSAVIAIAPIAVSAQTQHCTSVVIARGTIETRCDDGSQARIVIQPGGRIIDWSFEPAPRRERFEPYIPYESYESYTRPRLRLCTGALGEPDC